MNSFPGENIIDDDEQQNSVCHVQSNLKMSVYQNGPAVQSRRQDANRCYEHQTLVRCGIRAVAVAEIHQHREDDQIEDYRKRSASVSGKSRISGWERSRQVLTDGAEAHQEHETRQHEACYPQSPVQTHIMRGDQRRLRDEEQKPRGEHGPVNVHDERVWWSKRLLPGRKRDVTVEIERLRKAEKDRRHEQNSNRGEKQAFAAQTGRDPDALARKRLLFDLKARSRHSLPPLRTSAPLA